MLLCRKQFISILEFVELITIKDLKIVQMMQPHHCSDHFQ